MRRLVLVTLLAVPIAAVLAAAQDAALIKKGSEVYVAQKCSLCHSIAGKGNKQNPLDGVGAKLSADDIKHWIVNPKEMEAKLATKPKMPMKAFPKLPAADLDALVAYMLSLK